MKADSSEIKMSGSVKIRALSHGVQTMPPCQLSGWTGSEPMQVYEWADVIEGVCLKSKEDG